MDIANIKKGEVEMEEEEAREAGSGGSGAAVEKK